VQIVPDEMTNSLLVRASEADWNVLQSAIEALDLRPLQVLIEAVVAEVRRTSQLDVGISVQTDRNDTEGTQVELTLEGTSTGNFALDVMRFGRTNVTALLSILATEGTVRIVSRPVILAQNNQEARILIGEERPFVQVFRSLPTDAAVRDQVVQYRDVGTSLTIVPSINADGYVDLELTQEISSATSEIQFGAPVISTREVSTQLFLRDGQTAVIGGLIARQLVESESGIPLLKDIPLLGNLFKSTSASTIQSELFLFVTPHIVQTDEDLDRIRTELGRQIDEQRPDTLDLSIIPDPVGRAIPPDTTGGGNGPPRPR